MCGAWVSWGWGKAAPWPASGSPAPPPPRWAPFVTGIRQQAWATPQATGLAVGPGLPGTGGGIHHPTQIGLSMLDQGVVLTVELVHRQSELGRCAVGEGPQASTGLVRSANRHHQGCCGWGTPMRQRRQSTATWRRSQQ